LAPSLKTAGFVDPINFEAIFTVGMAARERAGACPPLYEGFGSEAKHKALVDAEDAKI
jgi:hypothetical protein